MAAVQLMVPSTGLWVAAEYGGGGAVVANRRRPGPWETFQHTPLTGWAPGAPGDFVALITANGWCMQSVGGILTATTNCIGTPSRWQLIHLGGLSYQVLGAEGYWRLMTDDLVASDWSAPDEFSEFLMMGG